MQPNISLTAKAFKFVTTARVLSPIHSGRFITFLQTYLLPKVYGANFKKTCLIANIYPYNLKFSGITQYYMYLSDFHCKRLKYCYELMS